jgi:hypothetical protein
VSAVQATGARTSRARSVGARSFGVRRPAWLSGAVIAAVVGLTSAVAAWYRLDAVARDTLWAEDGRLFLERAASGPTLPTIAQPYAGYEQLIPRLMALATVRLVPVEWWALSMTALSCLAAGAVAAIVFLASREVVGWMPARIAISLLTVLTPLASREVLGNAANLHSLLFWGVLWVLLAVPRSRFGQVGYAVFVLCAALSETQVVFLLPLLLWRMRDRRTWLIKAALVLGAAAQLAAEFVAPRPAATVAQNSPLSIAEGWIINGIDTSWVPIPRVGEALATALPGMLLLATIPLGAIVVTTLLGTRAQRAVSWILLAGSTVVWTAGVVVDPAPYYQYAGMSAEQLSHVWLSRYGVVPAMMLLAEVALAAAVLARHPTRESRGALAAAASPRRRLVAVALLVALAVPLVLQAPENLSRRAVGPAWSPQISAAAEVCEAPRTATADLRETIGWQVAVPCLYFAKEGGRSDAAAAVTTLLGTLADFSH